MAPLSPVAEAFLARLAKQLRPLSPDEREAVLLELRSHLGERQRQGMDVLRAALDDMGSPETLAKEFIEATMTAMRDNPSPPRPVLLPPVIVNSNLPAIYRRGVPRLAVGEIIQDLSDTFAATGDGLWGACAFLVAGFTVTGFVAMLHGTMPDHVAIPTWLMLGIRLAISIVGSAVAYRCILGQDESVWHVDMPIIRFTLASMVLMLVIFAPSNFLQSGLAWAGADSGEHAMPFYHQPLSLLLWISTTLIALRLQPWAVSLALDRPITRRSSWEGTAGKSGALAVAWGVTVGPALLAHIGMTFVSVRLPAEAATSFGLLICFVDSLIAMAMTVAATLLNAMTYRWVTREPIPAPRPFSSTRPTDAQIAETNLRFRRFLAEKQRRDMELRIQDSVANMV